MNKVLLAVVLSFMMIGCSNDTAVPTSSAVPLHGASLHKTQSDAPFWAVKTPIMQGNSQTYVADVYTWNDRSTVYFTIVPIEGFVVSESYLVISTDASIALKPGDNAGQMGAVGYKNGTSGNNLEYEVPITAARVYTSPNLTYTTQSLTAGGYTYLLKANVGPEGDTQTSMACAWSKSPVDVSKFYSTCSFTVYEVAVISGLVNYDDCNSTITVNLPVSGDKVTLSNTLHGEQSLITDNAGRFSSTLVPVGTWSVSSVYTGETKTVTVIGDADVTFYKDQRPNGSCAEIVGHVDKIECIGQAPVTGVYAGVTVNGGMLGETTTDANGNFTFANVPNGTYSITVDGVSLDVTVSGSQGSFTAGTYTLDLSGPVCGGDEELNCSLSQGYWFAKPQAVWPGGSVTLGGFTYTQAEGKAIWNTTNKGGLLNAKAAFTQAAAIKLSGASVAAKATVNADIAIIDAYFASLGRKITPSTIPANSKTGVNAAAGAAAGRVGSWIDANHCAE